MKRIINRAIMKIINYTAATIFAVSALFASCGKEQPIENDNTLSHSISFIAEQMDTKTTMTIGADKATFEWEDADTMNLHVYEDDAEATSVTGTIGNDGKLSVNATFKGAAPAGATYYAYLNSDIRTQSPDAECYDDNADVLAATFTPETGVSSVTGKLLSFERAVAINKMTLKGITAGETIQSVTITSSEDIAGVYEKNAWTAPTKTLSITPKSVSATAEGAVIYFTCLPAEGAMLTVEVATKEDNGQLHFYEKEFQKAISFTRGNVKPFNVTVSPVVTKSVTLTAKDLTTGTYKEGSKKDSDGNDWGYYASVNNQSGTLYFGLNNNKANYHIASPIFDGRVRGISFKAYNGSASVDRKVLICSSKDVAQPETGDIAEVVVPKAEKFTNLYSAVFPGTPYVNRFYIYVSEALGISEITVEYEGTVYSEAPQLTPACLPFVFDDGINEVNNNAAMQQKELGSDYNTSPKLKFDDTGDYLLIGYNESAKSITYTLKGNGLSGEYAFDLCESSDGVHFTTVASCTSISGTAESKTNSLDSDSRYVKFVYSKKATGNVALGDITITSLTSEGPAPTTYSVTVAGGLSNGTVTVSPTRAAEGQIVTITATAATGYKVKSVSAKKTASGDALDVTNNQFTMPAEAVTVSAEFEEDHAPDPGTGTTEYSFTIQGSDFNTTSYAANNGSHEFTATCTTDSSKTIPVECTSNQVMKNSNNMQWQKNNGYIYNTTDLGTIKSITINSTAGTFTTYYGTEENPNSGTTVGGGFFNVKVGGATGTTSSIVVVFEK